MSHSIDILKKNRKQKIIFICYLKNNLWKKRGLSIVPVRYVHGIPTTRFYARYTGGKKFRLHFWIWKKS